MGIAPTKLRDFTVTRDPALRAWAVTASTTPPSGVYVFDKDESDEETLFRIIERAGRLMGVM